MSIWTFERSATALVLVALISGCAALPGGSLAPDEVEVVGGAVTVTGPQGYCVDTATRSDGAAGAVVLLGSCAALRQTSTAPRPDRDAVLSATVAAAPGASALGATEDLTEFFRGEAGRAMLSRSGAADTVELLDAYGREGVLFLHLRDSSAFDGPRVAPQYWRALMELRGHLVTLSVLSPEGDALSPQGGLSTLEAFVREMLRANPPASASS